MRFDLRRGFAAACLFVFAACFSGPAESPPPLVELLAVEPTRDVPLDAPVFLLFSGAVAADPSAERAIEVLRTDGRRAEAHLEALDEVTWKLHPIAAWPAAERLSFRIGGLIDALGRAVIEADPPRFFDTEQVTGPPVLTLRTPAPGTIAPLNLRSIVVSVAPAADTSPTKLVLTSEGSTVTAPITARSEELLIAEIAPFQGVCTPLCPGMRYQVSLDRGSSALGEALTAIVTSTSPDLSPPLVQLKDVRSPGGRIAVHLTANEPILARGTLWSAAGDPVPLIGAPIASKEQVLVAERQVDPYLVNVAGIAAEDLAGNDAAAMVFEVIAPPMIAVRLNEVVAHPLHDWGDSDPSGERFDASPGGGSVTDADEWIELVNLSETAIDLFASRLQLRVLDGTPSETLLATAPALHFSSGGSVHAWLPGEALVVHPRGAMAQDDVSIEVVWGSELLDRIELGSSPTADHAGGRPIDLEHEALARDAAQRWRWCAPTPGDPSPAVRCSD